MHAPLPGRFEAPLALANRHIQSIAGRAPWQHQRLRRRAKGLLASSQATVLDCGDGVRLLGLLSKQPQLGRALVVLLHGWEGCAASDYMLSMGGALYNAGFDVFRLNFRDHGGTFDLNLDLFHSCRITEVVNAVANIASLNLDQPLMLAGQSLGGNFALRVAVRAKTAGIAIERVIAVCPVLRPHSTMQALDEGWWLYRYYFLHRWRGSLAAKAAAFPGCYQFGDLRRFRTLTATTDFFVREYTEFPDLDAYLNGYALTGNALAELAVSSRVIIAADDPIIPVRDLALIARPEIMQVDLYRQGGHCGFVHNYAFDSWIAEELVADFSRALLRRS
jgi:predicted alpha/beta-fold hydrolase